MVKHRRIATWASSPRGARPGQDGQSTDPHCCFVHPIIALFTTLMRFVPAASTHAAVDSVFSRRLDRSSWIRRLDQDVRLRSIVAPRVGKSIETTLGRDQVLQEGLHQGSVPNVTHLMAKLALRGATSHRMLLLQVFEVSFDEATYRWHDVLSKRRCVKGCLCSSRWSSTWFEFRGELTRLVDALSRHNPRIDVLALRTGSMFWTSLTPFCTAISLRSALLRTRKSSPISTPREIAVHPRVTNHDVIERSLVR
ncbi:hypothetical protein BHM03_00005904 [Ensete ventricosum]|nr:hypothetical protein BHM03_00005904 [Ensete ventricosum]